MNQIGYLSNQCTIWELLGGVSAINGLICFALSSTYKISFGKLGIIVGLLFYVLLSSTMLFLIWKVKRVGVSGRFQGHVKALVFIVICSISVMFDKVVPGKSDALSIISYASFALMSLSMSRKCELGFETGFFSFFLSLFFQQLCKINLKLSPIALLFCLAVFVLRHYSESYEVQLCSNSQDSSGLEESSGDIPLLPCRRANKLVVRVIEAKKLRRMRLLGVDNPYVRIQLGRQKKRTKVIWGSLNPKWDEEFCFMVNDVNEELQFTVMSKKRIMIDEPMGHINVPLSLVLEEESLGTAWYSLRLECDMYKGKDCGKILLSIYFAHDNSALDGNDDSSVPLLNAFHE